jgi:spoIIIJ-associated protein
MKDRTFTGRDVPEALAAAEKSLGLPSARLRYVVLAEGRPGSLGLGGTPAEIAVLLDDTRPEVETRPAPESPPSPRAPAAPKPAADPRDVVVKVLKALVDATGIQIGVQVEEDAETLKVTLAGADQAFFLDHDAEVLDALEYLLRRALPGEGFPRLVLECEGRRQQREEGLRRTAQELAAQVLLDGAARTTPPLNAYERRVIHMTVAETPGLRTHSVGEGVDRRVTITPVFPDDIE